MADYYTLERLIWNGYSLNDVNDLLHCGYIGEALYWQYFHAWLHSGPRLGNHGRCQCGECVPAYQLELPLFDGESE